MVVVLDDGRDGCRCYCCCRCRCHCRRQHCKVAVADHAAAVQVEATAHVVFVVAVVLSFAGSVVVASCCSTMATMARKARKAYGIPCFVCVCVCGGPQKKGGSPLLFVLLFSLYDTVREDFSFLLLWVLTMVRI